MVFADDDNHLSTIRQSSSKQLRTKGGTSGGEKFSSSRCEDQDKRKVEHRDHQSDNAYAKRHRLSDVVKPNKSRKHDSIHKSDKHKTELDSRKYDRHKASQKFRR